MYTTPRMQRYNAIMDALRQAQGPHENSVVPEPVEGPQNILSKERVALQELKSLLTGEKQLPADQLQKEITHLITEREYLYLHFPDGHKFAYTQSFLNRVRVEIDYFLKIIRW